MNHAEQPLASLPIGCKGRVTAINAAGMVRRRLLDLGLVPGTVVEPIRRSPLGDPTAFNIRGAIIALRSEEASRVLVQPIRVEGSS